MLKSPRSLGFHQFVLTALLVLVCQPALAEKRVALVIGNSTYQNVAPLANPVNDGTVMASTLKDAGFDVVDFRRDLKPAACCATLPIASAMPTSPWSIMPATASRSTAPTI